MTYDAWKEYFEKTKNKPPRPLLVKALSYLRHEESALDLGSGALNDSLYLLEKGFKNVVAVDKEPVAQDMADNFPSDRFRYVISSFESFDFPTAEFDLVNAQYSLPFIAPDQFEMVFQKAVRSLKDGGIIVGQFFGDRDEWNTNKKMTFQAKEQVLAALATLETLHLEEEERDKPTAAGHMKHWHVFHFIARA